MDSLSKKSGDKIECLLCPHNCKLREGSTGICGVRKNSGGHIELLTYGVISGYAQDPVEKKPLYHFYPGTNILSIGSYGCNMRCDFCQNYNISQKVLNGYKEKTEPDEIIRDALSSRNNTGIAFTYNEPVIWFEFVKDVALRAREKGMKTVMVTNGFVNPDPLKEIISFTDAFNVDLKAFNNSFYKKLTGADIEPVKKSLKQIAKSGRHLEITTLVIPGQNDDMDEMESECKWIADELGKHIPFHLSRYFPMYKRNDPSTDTEALIKLADIASKYLDYVYTGNMENSGKQNTYCPHCGAIITERSGYSIKHRHLSAEGKCRKCGNLIYNHFIPT